ncbi:hypothetical protein [Planctomicrobium sp. SH527]|uniref:hypothetical protein n=1 Tax=Planctomicrobium sp. SH527 TaxID=3448123 RepID=UPI003F5B0FDC
MSKLLRPSGFRSSRGLRFQNNGLWIFNNGLRFELHRLRIKPLRNAAELRDANDNG